MKSGEVKSEEEVKSEKKSIEGENADEKLE